MYFNFLGFRTIKITVIKKQVMLKKHLETISKDNVSSYRVIRSKKIKNNLYKREGLKVINTKNRIKDYSNLRTKVSLMN